MGTDATVVLSILGVAGLLFVSGRIPQEVVAVLVLVGLTVSGIVEPKEALAGFSSNAVIAIAALLVTSGGLVRSGVVRWIARRLQSTAGGRAPRLLLLSTLLPGILSGFINIVAAVSLFIPAVMRLGRKSGTGKRRWNTSTDFPKVCGNSVSREAPKRRVASSAKSTIPTACV